MKELNNVIDTHQQLLSQLSENHQVLKVGENFPRSRLMWQEFEKLEPDARVFKRLGPVLLPQEFAEAKTNVEKRIDFIQTESYVIHLCSCSAVKELTSESSILSPNVMSYRLRYESCY